MTILPLFLAAGAAFAAPATPVKHLVVIFQENVSFDHYFGAYPNALNPAGEPAFHALPGTPAVNGLEGPLLAANPNSAAPKRLSRAQAATCDMDHSYGQEQQAYHGGLMDRFVESVGAAGAQCDPKVVMDYFDGNTVTALWNYAQHYAMSDDYFNTVFGPSTPGALNLVSGRTQGAEPADLSDSGERLTVAGAVIEDPDPEFDDCSSSPTIRMTGTNVGELLSRKGVTWGWFEGGFHPSHRASDGRAACANGHTGSFDRRPRPDYVPHHEPFQYYKATANPHHLPPTSVAMIGHDDQANHQYDLRDFWLAAESGNLPQVSYLKAPAYQNGHAGYSDPLSEQRFLVETLNRLQKLPQWKDMAVVLTYDDSDGWYDHVMPPIVSKSGLKGVDVLVGEDLCGHPAAGEPQGRCGYGPRLPLLVISPFVRPNTVSHSIMDQTSILRFIEDNWELGRIGGGSFDEKAGSLLPLFDWQGRAPKLTLDPSTGEPL